MLASDSKQHQRHTPVTKNVTVGLPVPIGDHDHSAQREWEHFQVAKGVERFRKTMVRVQEDGSVKARSLGETTPGQRIATELIGPMVAAVQNRQAEYAAMCMDKNVKKLPDAPTVLTLLPAETLAACAVLTALAHAVEAPYTSVRIAAAARVRHELEYQEWKRAEATAEKERKNTGEDGVNLFKLMLKRNDVVDKRAFDKWSKKANLFRTIQWTHEQKVHIGSELMALLVGSNGWFKVEEMFKPETGKTQLVFGMTETALAAASSLEGQCELQRPFMAPMICEPQDFTYADEAEPAADEVAA